MKQRTWTARKEDLHGDWYVVDATGVALGRLASSVARLLKGKHKPTYTPHLNTGDHVVVVNAEKVRLTGRKANDKMYFRHTMYPGGVRWTNIQDVFAAHPERVIQHAVQGMMPKTKLGRAMIKKLKVYAGPAHPHAAQNPTAWDPGSRGGRA